MTQLAHQSLGQRSSILTHAAMDILHRVCGLEVVPSLRHWNDSDFMQATVQLQGDRDLTLVLAMGQEPAPAVAGRLSGFEVPYDSRDMESAMENLAFILADALQERLRRRGVHVRPVQACVQRRHDGQLLPENTQLLKQVCLDSEFGPVIVAVCEP